MMTNIIKVGLAALCLGLGVAPVQALVIGEADDVNGMPFGGNVGGYYYQQIYSAGAFDGPISIDTISFYNSLLPGGQPRSGPFALFLSTTDLDVASFDTTNGVDYPWFDASFTEVFNGEAPAVADGRLVFDLTAGFDYDPAQGNLVLTVREFSLSQDSGLFLDVDENDGLTNSRFYSYPYDWNQGLVTGFNDTAAAVPEPASWALMIGGFALAGGALRRRGVAIRFA